MGPLLFRVYVGDDILPSYVGIIINNYKDPYETTSIMESDKVFFGGSDQIIIWDLLISFIRELFEEFLGSMAMPLG